MLVRSAGNAGLGPSSTFRHVFALVVATRSLWVAGDDHVLAADLAAQGRRGRIRPGPSGVLRHRVLDESARPWVTPASAMNEPISMWSGAIVCARAQAAGAVDGHHVRAIPSIGRHRDQHPRQVLPRAAGGSVADHGRARVTPRPSARSRSPSPTLVHQEVAGAQAGSAHRA